MQIVHVMTGDLWAGAEVQLYETLVNRPEGVRDTVSVVLFSSGELATKLFDKDIDICVIDEKENSSISIMSKLVGRLNSKKPSIVHVHDYKSHVITSFAIYKSCEKPAVIRTLHGLKVVPRTLKMLKSYGLNIVENIFLRYRTDCIIAVSEDIEEITRQKYKGVRVEQINNAITIPGEQDEEYKGRVREKYGIKKGDVWIVAASRLVEIKNVRMLIDAIEKIDLVDIAGIVVSIFGDGPLRNELEQRVERCQLGKVIKMHGHNHAIVEIMPAFDIFVNTSIHEGMPMSILEAMACEVSPVCTRVGGLKELIEHSKNGMLVELNDTDALAEILVYLKNNAICRQKIGTAARSQIVNNFDIRKSVVRLNAVYESILSH